MTKPEKNIMTFSLMAVHPDVSSNKPVNASVSINEVNLTNVTFYAKGRKYIEIDLSKYEQLSDVIKNKDYVLVKLDVDRTWIPAEVYPQFKQDNFNVGVAVTPIVWTDKLSPPKPKVLPTPQPPPAPKTVPPADTNSPAKAELKPEPKSETK